jgi:preprotein translocase subunit Sss1
MFYAQKRRELRRAVSSEGEDSTTRSSRVGVAPARTPVQTTTLAVAIVFLLVGILGFVPGITTDYPA